jgi:hypothetical protein
MPMRQNSPDIQLLAGSSDYEAMPRLKPYVPFDDTVVTFFDELSRLLIKHPDGRLYSDIISFGFFCRKANLTMLKKPYENSLSYSVGRGVSFHVAPSNVAINFAYSLAVGLLSGNACIVRISSKHFPQTNIVNDMIARVLEKPEFVELKKHIAIVKYGHSNEINQFFSHLCDIRIIWGGDNTIAEIRKAFLPPRSFDITFADRYSLCIIKAGEYLNIKNKKQVALDFYNDTYIFDQNACSSPRLVYWVGSPEIIAKAKEIFWNMEQDLLVEKNYRIESATAVDKYTVSCRAALDYDGAEITKVPNNLISRIELKTLPSNLMEHVCAGGSYFEYSFETPDNLAEIVTRKFQTLTYIGFDGKELSDLLIRKGVLGIDRVVPCGKSADFALIWDGYDLIRQMSRVMYTV